VAEGQMGLSEYEIGSRKEETEWKGQEGEDVVLRPSQL
jgi:hypothetical protein